MKPASTVMHRVAPPPVQLFVELTTACNLHCNHCYIRGGEGRVRALSGMDLHGMLDEFRELGGRFVSFSGGEPVLHRGWRPAMRYARFLGLDTILLSNGTLLKQDDLAFLREIDSHLAISIDGHRATTHDTVRGEGAFQRTLETLQSLADADLGPRSTLCFTPSAINYSELPGVVALADRLGIGTVYVSLLEDRGRAGESIDNLALPPAALRSLVFSIASMKERYPGVSVDCLNLKYFPERLRGLEVDGDGLDRTIRVTASGDIYLTAYLDDDPFHLGHYEQGNLHQIWHCSKVISALETAEARPYSIAVCRSCLAAKWCRAGSAAFAWTRAGTFDAVDGFCEAKQDLVRELMGLRL